MKFETVRLGEICKTNQRLYSHKDKWDYVHYLDTGNITQNHIDKIQFIDLSSNELPSRAKRKVNFNSIIFSTVRPNQLHYGIIKTQPQNFLVSTGFTVIDINSNRANADFIYYSLTRNEVIEYLQTIAEQSTSAYPSIKASDIEDLELSIPDIETQKKIASILSPLDAKIELNNAINENLEQQAQAIYQSFFSPRVSTQGQKRTLDEFCNIFTGRKNSNEAIIGGKNKFFTCSPETLQIDSYIYNGDAIIICGNGAYTGRTRFYSGKFDLYQRTYACTIKDNIDNDYIFPLYWFVKEELSPKIMGGTRGSAIPYIVMKDLAKFEFIFDIITIQKYLPILKFITYSIQHNENEIERLASIRDTLLPKLMKGEIDVSKVKI